MLAGVDSGVSKLSSAKKLSSTVSTPTGKLDRAIIETRMISFFILFVVIVIDQKKTFIFQYQHTGGGLGPRD
jgi:hypothetical protein